MQTNDRHSRDRDGPLPAATAGRPDSFVDPSIHRVPEGPHTSRGHRAAAYDPSASTPVADVLDPGPAGADVSVLCVGLK